MDIHSEANIGADAYNYWGNKKGLVTESCASLFVPELFSNYSGTFITSTGVVFLHQSFNLSA